MNSDRSFLSRPESILLYLNNEVVRDVRQAMSPATKSFIYYLIFMKTLSSAVVPFRNTYPHLSCKLKNVHLPGSRVSMSRERNAKLVDSKYQALSTYPDRACYVNLTADFRSQNSYSIQQSSTHDPEHFQFFHGYIIYAGLLRQHT